MEGGLSGIHRSPQRGASIEFAEYKEYAPGDEIRHIDWKVYAKTDRYHVKQFEQETNLAAYLLLDASASMGYQSKNRSKFDYAIRLAAAFAYLLLRQGDSVGLLFFNEALEHYIPPRSKSAHLQIIIDTLSQSTPKGKTDLPRVLTQFAEKLHARSLILIFSDLFDDPDRVIRSLKQFRHRKHEILLFHLLDPYERHFPFDETTLFVDIEGDQEILVDPREIKDRYLALIQQFIDEYRRRCLADQIDYVQITTHDPIEQILTRYLARRSSTQRI